MSIESLGGQEAFLVFGLVGGRIVVFIFGVVLVLFFYYAED